jgi:hypothetical protein
LQDMNQQALDRDASRAQCVVGMWRRQHERGVCSAAMLAWSKALPTCYRFMYSTSSMLP